MTGDVVVVEAQREVALARYHPDRRLDAGFGSKGVARTEVLPGRHDGAYAVARLPEGGAIVIGTSFDTDNDFLLVFAVRYAPAD